MDEFCVKCPKRNECKQICPELEEYLNKKIPKCSREINFSDVSEMDKFIIDEYVDEYEYLKPYKSSFPDAVCYDYWDIKKLQDKHKFSDDVFEQLFQYCVMGLTQEEAAAVCGCSQQNISKNVTKYLPGCILF